MCVCSGYNFWAAWASNFVLARKYIHIIFKVRFVYQIYCLKIKLIQVKSHILRLFCTFYELLFQGYLKIKIMVIWKCSIFFSLVSLQKTRGIKEFLVHSRDIFLSSSLRSYALIVHCSKCGRGTWITSLWKIMDLLGSRSRPISHQGSVKKMFSLWNSLLSSYHKRCNKVLARLQMWMI